MRTLSIAEVKASYEQKRDWEKQFPVSALLFRPLSFPLTALASRLTNSPSAIAWAGLAVGAAACGLLFMYSHFGPWPGIAGLALFALMDAIDGNMARATGSVTRYGKFLDGTLGKLAEGLYLPALSAGLYFAKQSGPDSMTPSSAGLLLSGFTALIAMLYSSYIESAYDALSNEARGGERPDPGAKIGSSRYRGNIFYAVFINLHALNVQILLLSLAALSGREDLFLAFITAYYLSRLAVIFPYYIIKARTELG